MVNDGERWGQQLHVIVHLQHMHHATHVAQMMGYAGGLALNL
jgi:hypothetical protein